MITAEEKESFIKTIISNTKRSRDYAEGYMEAYETFNLLDIRLDMMKVEVCKHICPEVERLITKIYNIENVKCVEKIR